MQDSARSESIDVTEHNLKASSKELSNILSYIKTSVSKLNEPVAQLENKLAEIKMSEDLKDKVQDNIATFEKGNITVVAGTPDESDQPRIRSHTVAVSKPFDKLLRDIRHKKSSSASQNKNSTADLNLHGVNARKAEASVNLSRYLYLPNPKVYLSKIQSVNDRLKEKYLTFFKHSHVKSSEKVIESLEKLSSSNPGSGLRLNIEKPGHVETFSVQDEDLIPEPLELLDKLKSVNHSKYYWPSPVITDEFYIMNYLFDGDLVKATIFLQRLSGLNLASSLSSIDDNPKTPEAASSASLTNSTDKIQGETSFHSSDGIIDKVLPHSEDILSVSLDSELPKAPKLPKKHDKLDKTTIEKRRSKTFLKFNSCSTLFTVDSTLFKPSSSPKTFDITIRAVSYAISCHLQRTYTLYNEIHAFEKKNKLGRRFTSRIFYTSDILSERSHPIWKIRVIPEEVAHHPEIMQPPTVDELNHFIRQIFLAADLNAEVAIISLIYLERLMLKARVSLHSLNCFRAILGSIILASKVWDDQAIWNVDFKTIMNDLKLRSLNYLERWWLHKLNFDISVKRAVFANYWFEIREVADKVLGVKIGILEAVSTKELQPKSPSVQKRPIMAPKTANMLMDPAYKEMENTISRKLRPDLSVTIPKPLTEEYMSKISALTTYSQSKLRQTFSESLSAPLYDSTGMWEEIKGHRVPRSSTQILNTRSNSQSGSIADCNISESNKTIELHSAAKTNSGKSEVVDFGWGGSKLRKSKSDDCYKPIAPAASVL